MQNYTFKKILVSFFIAFFAIIAFSEAQNCNSDLSIYQNRDKRSVTMSSPTNFKMVLSNNNSKSVTYDLAVNNKVIDCNSTAKRIQPTSQNLGFKISFLQNTRKINSITVPAYGNATFYVNVASPSDFRYDTYTCIEVTATAQNCQKGPVNSIIKVYTPNPSDN